MENFDKKEISSKMAKTIASYKKDIGTLRTGRANPSMLDLIRVDVYGQKLPINQLATVTIPEPRAEYDVSNQRQILEALDTLKNQLNFSFQTDFKNEQDTFNWFIS